MIVLGVYYKFKLKLVICFSLLYTGLFISYSSYSQQRPHYTQYILNNFIVNPALAGIENYTDVKLSYRNQWVGFPGAPKTYYVTVHGPIGKKDFRTNPTSFQIPGNNPRGSSYWENYTAAEAHHGIGASFINYKTGYISRSYATLSYAYHVGLTPTLNLSAGFSGGISTMNIDASKIELANPTDPAIGSTANEIRKVNPELNAGIFLYSGNFFAGLSAQQIIPQKIALVATDYNKSTLVPHLFATTGVRFLAGEDINILPSIMVRYIPSMPIFYDFTVKAQYHDRFWLGGNLRLKEGFAAMTGINITNAFNLSYSYDVNNSKYLLQYMQRGTHEVVLGFMLGNNWGDYCPRRVW